MAFDFQRLPSCKQRALRARAEGYIAPMRETVQKGKDARRYHINPVQCQRTMAVPKEAGVRAAVGKKSL